MRANLFKLISLKDNGNLLFGSYELLVRCLEILTECNWRYHLIQEAKVRLRRDQVARSRSNGLCLVSRRNTVSHVSWRSSPTGQTYTDHDGFGHEKGVLVRLNRRTKLPSNTAFLLRADLQSYKGYHFCLTRARPNGAITSIVFWPWIFVVWLLFIRVLYKIPSRGGERGFGQYDANDKKKSRKEAQSGALRNTPA